MNTLFRFAMEYVVPHASILVNPMDLSDLDHNLGFSGSSTCNPNDREVLDLTANPPQCSEGEQQSNVPPPATKAPTGPSLKKDLSVADAFSFDGLFDSSASGSAPTAITNDGDLKIAASPPCTLPPKVVEPPFEHPSQQPTKPASQLPGDFVSALSLLPTTPVNQDEPVLRSPDIKQTFGIPEYIYTSEEEQQVPEGCPFMIGDSMFVAPASLTDYCIACRTSTEMKDLICFITVCRHLGLNCATSATLMNASLNDSRIKHCTEKATLNVSYLLKSINARDEKERQGVLKKCISEIQSFFERVYRRHKQTTIRFADPIAVADAPNPKPTTSPPTPSSAQHHSTTVAATPPQTSVGSLPRPASAGPAPSHASMDPRKRGAAQSGANNNNARNNNSRLNNNNKKA
jgi:hypothetical protein